MSDIDELLAELTQPRPASAPPEVPPTPAPETAGSPRRRSVWWLAAGLALMVVLLSGLAALAIGGDESATGETTVGPSVGEGRSGTTDTAPTPSVATPAEPTAATPETSTTAPQATAGENRQGAVRYVTITSGQVTVRGEAPTRAIADALVATVAAATGGPVVDELTVAPTAPADTAVAVYLPDRLLFDFNSIEVDPAGLRQLDLTARLLAAFPQLTVRVVARTDATGSDDLNLRVADLRATAVCNYLLSIGASPSQIVLDPVGEADEPHDEPDDDDAALDRHVELVIDGTLRG